MKNKSITSLTMCFFVTRVFANNLDFSLPEGYEVIESKHTRMGIFEGSLTGLVHRIRFRISGHSQIRHVHVRIGNYRNVRSEERVGSLTASGFVWGGNSEGALPSGEPFHGFIQTRQGKDKYGRPSATLWLGSSFASVTIGMSNVSDPLRRCEEIATRLQRNLAAQLRIIGTGENERVVKK
jgi:hypothetical protein